MKEGLETAWSTSMCQGAVLTFWLLACQRIRGGSWSYYWMPPAPQKCQGASYPCWMGVLPYGPHVLSITAHHTAPLQSALIRPLLQFSVGFVLTKLASVNVFSHRVSIVLSQGLLYSLG